MAKYTPNGPLLACPCGLKMQCGTTDLIDEDTGEYKGAIWQKECDCGRAYTVETAKDPDYPEEG